MYRRTSTNGGEPVKHECWLLVDVETNTPIRLGDQYQDDEGAMYVIAGGKPPVTPTAAGRVFVLPADSKWARPYFPTALGAKWAVV